MTKSKPHPVFTKTGDSGTSALLDGKRFPKSHPIFHVLGEIDELNSFLGWAKLASPAPFTACLTKIQRELYLVSASLAGARQTQLPSKAVSSLESHITTWQNQIGNNWHQAFLIPGGTEFAARLDITRTVCRRAERTFYYLKDYSFNFKLPHFNLYSTYLNRLSDFLYVLRVFHNYRTHHPDQTLKSLHPKTPK